MDSELPYFDVVRYHCIDVMHNLLLGLLALKVCAYTEDTRTGTREHLTSEKCKGSVSSCVSAFWAIS